MKKVIASSLGPRAPSRPRVVFLGRAPPGSDGTIVVVDPRGLALVTRGRPQGQPCRHRGETRKAPPGRSFSEVGDTGLEPCARRSCTVSTVRFGAVRSREGSGGRAPRYSDWYSAGRRARTRGRFERPRRPPAQSA